MSHLASSVLQAPGSPQCPHPICPDSRNAKRAIQAQPDLNLKCSSRDQDCSLYLTKSHRARRLLSTCQADVASVAVQSLRCLARSQCAHPRPHSSTHPHNTQCTVYTHNIEHRLSREKVRERKCGRRVHTHIQSLQIHSPNHHNGERPRSASVLVVLRYLQPAAILHPTSCIRHPSSIFENSGPGCQKCLPACHPPPCRIVRWGKSRSQASSTCTCYNNYDMTIPPRHYSYYSSYSYSTIEYDSRRAERKSSDYYLRSTEHMANGRQLRVPRSS